jgi:hypothetical protein
MALNGTRTGGNLMEKYLGFILSLISALLVGCGSFLFKVSVMMTRWEERDFEKTNSINRVEQKVNSVELKVNTVQMDVSDLKIATTRIETKQNLKP